MDDGEKSLRQLVDKWLGVTATTPGRVTQFGRMRSHQRARYVCIEASRAADSIAFFFFRHNNGSWYIFPPP